MSARSRPESLNSSGVPELTEEELSDLHDVQLELLAEMRRLCELHSLRFFALYGTLLGAIRHRGFIPWDDDLDLGMVRTDYERFLEVAKTDVSARYFFQSVDSDPEYYSPLGKLRKNGTVFYERASGTGGQHRGIFIDLFPLDVKPARRTGQAIQNGSTYVLKRLLMIMGGYEIGAGRRGLRRAVRVLAGAVSRILPRSLVVRLLGRQMARSGGGRAAKYVSIAGPYTYSRQTVEAEWLDELVEIPFENTTIPAFKDADAYLTRLYGDYMTPPPIGDRVGHHDLIELDFGNA